MTQISIDDALTGTDAISQVRATASGPHWLTRIAAEDGRTTIHTMRNGEVVDLTPDASVRSRVMEYGGGAHDAAGDIIAYCDDLSQQVMVLEADEHRAIADGGRRYRFGGLHLVPDQRLLLAVREDHDAQPEPRTEIVSLDLDSSNPDGGVVLITGADFYGGPRVHDQTLAWFQWDHPNMSWDTCSVWTAPLADPQQRRAVVDQEGVSALHPMWLSDGSLATCSDESGFWNWRIGERTWSTPHDCTLPVWVLDAPAACPVSDDEFASVVLRDGFGGLALWQPSTGQVTASLEGTSMIESIAAHDGTLYVIAEWPDRPATLEVLHPDGRRETLIGGDPLPGAVTPRTIQTVGGLGPVQSFLYPVPGVEAPPLLVMTHGGPTAATTASYDRPIQFWVSRGVAVLDVNYSGSTGFGRDYRERLKGQWGVAEVTDVIDAVREVTGLGLADPDRVVITGGSAGGYTTLQALVTSDVFAAGMSRYGIADLRALAHDTHKAESRYLDGLISPYEGNEELWLARSPITQLDSLTTPMLILQGTDDKVVPPNQAELMAAAVRDKGLPVALVMFDGEGHGFRSMAARRQALEAQVSFLQQVLDLPHSEDVPLLAIENHEASTS